MILKQVKPDERKVWIVKRMITAVLFSLAVTVFFTGCSSLVGSMEVDYEEIQTSAAAEAVTDENGENRLGITEETKVAPDYFEQNMTEKFKELEGKEAFRIKAGHSKEAGDMEGFQIAGLKSDKTFVYGYVTRAEDGGSPRQVVHCAAFYNYASGDFQVFHETVYRRQEEDENEETASGQPEGEESFFVQVCDPGGDIFVYDNGHGYLYSSDGTVKFHGDIETFIRKQFQDAFDVSVVNAVTDGQNRIYLEVSIEKEAIDVPELKAEDLELTRETPVDDDETEELDEEMEQKTESRVLVYEYKPVNSGMDQENEAFEKQKDTWIAQTAGKEYETAPDGMADWNQVVKDYPDQWGNAWLGSFGNAKVYRWKEETVFTSEEGVASFLPKPDSYVNFRDVKEQWELEKLFIPYNGRYSDLFGKTGNFIYYNPQEIEREYTYVWYEDGETSAEGEAAEPIKYTETRTQTISGINTKRYAPLENAYVESYWVMDKEKAVSLGKCIGGEIQCTGQDERVRWIKPGGELSDTPYKVTEDTQAGAFLDGGVIYYVEFGKDSMAIVRDGAHGGNKKETPQKILYGKLAGGYEPGDSVYDAMFEEKNEDNLPEMESVYGIDYYTEEQVLHANLSLDMVLAGELKARGAEGICDLALGGHTQGFLLTSQDKGLMFYDPVSEASAVLEKGSWFGTWKIGNQYVSVGFLNGERSYNSLDAAFSRVYEYNLSALCNESMKASLKELKEKEAEEARRQAEEASRQAESPSEAEREEATDSPLDQWNEGYKKKYSREQSEEDSETIP